MMINERPKVLTTKELAVTKKHLVGIQNRFSELKAEAVEDFSPIVNYQLEDKHFDMSPLAVKWANLRDNFYQAWTRHERQRENAFRELYVYFVKDHPMNMDKAQILVFIRTDDCYADLHEQGILLKCIVDYCDRMHDQSHKRGYEVKNTLDYLRWKSGNLD